VDTEPSLLIHNSFEEGVINAVAEHEPSFVLIGLARAELHTVVDNRGESIARSITEPLAVIVGNVERITGVMLFESQDVPDTQQNDGVNIASEVATRLGGKAVSVVCGDGPATMSNMVPGQIGVTALALHRDLRSVDPPPGAAVVVVLRH
jgi:hypothetical protein